MLKEQVSLRFDKITLELIKARAKAQNRSFNNYILNLCTKDIIEAEMFPYVKVDEIPDDLIGKLAGDGSKIPTERELIEDERLKRIWER